MFTTFYTQSISVTYIFRWTLLSYWSLTNFKKYIYTYKWNWNSLKYLIAIQSYWACASRQWELPYIANNIVRNIMPGSAKRRQNGKKYRQKNEQKNKYVHK